MNEVKDPVCDLFHLETCYYREGDEAINLIVKNIANKLRNHGIEYYDPISYLTYLRESIDSSINLIEEAKKGKTMILSKRFG